MKKKLLSLMLILSLFAVPLSAGAAIITAPVDVDTYYVFMGGSNGYPLKDVVKTYDPGVMTSIGLLRFDLSNLTGVATDDIISAQFNFYAQPQGFGAPEGTTIYSSIHALDDSVILTEDMENGYGVIHGYNRPDNVGDAFTGQSTGTGSWGYADITDIVKNWVSGDLFNNGIEFADMADDGGYSVHFTSIQGDVAYHPYLQVNAVPIPGAIYLFGSGLIALIGLRRKKV